MERTLIYGIILVAAIYILNLNMSRVASKGIAFKLAVFFGIFTLILLAIGGINSDFELAAILSFFCMLILLGINFIFYLARIFSGKLELAIGLSVIAVIICELSMKLDPYGRVFYLIFNRYMNMKKIQLLFVVLFIILLSIKVFGALFFRKNLSILNQNAFKVKDGRGD